MNQPGKYTARTALVLALVSAPLWAQTSTTFTSSRSLRFANRTLFARTNEVAAATIAFARGEYFGAQDILAGGQHVHVRPFGRKYADGSYRFGEAILRASVPAATASAPGVTTYSLSTTSTVPPDVPFDFGPNTHALANIAHAQLKNLQLFLSVNGGASVLDLKAAAGTTNGPETIVDDGPRRTLRFIGRHGDFVYVLYVYMNTGADYMTWELRLTNSGYAPTLPSATGTRNYTHVNPQVYFGTNMNCDIAMYGERGHQALGVGGYPGAAYANIGPTGHWRMGHRASLSANQTAFAYDATTLLQGYVLADGGNWADGQSQIWRGSLVVPAWDPVTLAATYTNELSANMTHPLIGMCQEWRAVGAYGPQEYLGPGSITQTTVDQKFQGFQDWLSHSGGWATLGIDLWERYVQGPGMGDFIGLAPKPWITGGQPDFGITEGWEAFASGDPRLAEMYGYLGYNASRRSCHRYWGPDANTAGAILHVTETSHPDPTKAVLYFTETFHPATKTHFFKNADAANPSGRGPSSTNPHVHNGWRSWRMSHMSINHLYTAYILNPWSRTLEEELDFHKEAWMLQNPDPNTTHQNWLNHYGEARAVGRSFFCMAQIANARGIHDYSPGSVLHRLYVRTHDCVLRCSTPNCTKGPGGWPLRASMLTSAPTSNRVAVFVVGSSLVDFWAPASATTTSSQKFSSFSPWEHMVGPYGLYAAYRMAADDGQGATFGAAHKDAAERLANTLLTHCTMWSDNADPWSAYAYPGTTLSGPLSVSLTATPLWMRIGYRYRWNPDASGHCIAATAAEVQNGWYFATPGSEFNLWAAPSVYLLSTGKLTRWPSTSAAEATTYVSFVGGTNYDRRWRWGQ